MNKNLKIGFVAFVLGAAFTARPLVAHAGICDYLRDTAAACYSYASWAYEAGSLTSSQMGGNMGGVEFTGDDMMAQGDIYSQWADEYGCY